MIGQPFCFDVNFSGWKGTLNSNYANALLRIGEKCVYCGEVIF
jgi:hypothetical protein